MIAVGIEEMDGSDCVPDPNDSKRAQVEMRKPTTRAEWRSTQSAYRSVSQKAFDTADIVRDGDLSPNYLADWFLARTLAAIVIGSWPLGRSEPAEGSDSGRGIVFLIPDNGKNDKKVCIEPPGRVRPPERRPPEFRVH
jgi:hypothetical protein